MKRVLFALSIWAVIFAIGYAIEGLHVQPVNYITMAVDYDSVGDTTAAGDNYVTGTVPLTGRGQDYASIDGSFIIDASPTTAHGFGLSDSCYIYVKTSNGIQTVVLGGDSLGSLPCTTHVSFTDTYGANDTVLFPNVYIEYRLTDTTSDTAFNAKYLYHGSFVFKVP